MSDPYMFVRNSQVGSAARSSKWSYGFGGKVISTTDSGVSLTTVWVQKKRWAISIDGKYSPIYFEGPRAAQRYLLGAPLRL